MSDEETTEGQETGHQIAPVVLPLVVEARVIWVRQYLTDLGDWRDATAHPCWCETDALIDLQYAKSGCETLPMRVVKRVIIDSICFERR